MKSSSGKKFQSLSDFYVFYLTEHTVKKCRQLHLLGTSLALIAAIILGTRGLYFFMPFVLVIGYGFSWIGHFVFEKNKPAAFQYPFYSFVCDFLMLRDFLNGSLDTKVTKALSSKK